MPVTGGVDKIQNEDYNGLRTDTMESNYEIC
jgi:hypothetical protein